MKIKNGFTLIELLAVIVILAIIALIATPIVLNIIDDTKKQAGLRSADFYLDGVELSIAQATLKADNITDGVYNIKDGNICRNADCSKTLPVEVKGEVPKNGSIYIKNGQIEDISLNINNETVIKKDGELAYIEKLEDICELKNDATPEGISAGDKYECKVKAGTSYNFYVLTTPQEGDTSINLIMNANINASGEAVIPGETSDTGLVAWINQGDYESVGGQNWSSSTDNNAFGPITAMNFLSEATKSWTNTNEIKTSTIEYENGTTYTMAKTYTTNARMPIYSTDATKTEVANKTESNVYLYDNLDPAGMNAPYGYWTLSPNAESSNIAWYVSQGRSVNPRGVSEASLFGVRPVINLKI